MVIATVSFLSVLVAAILVAIALCYRMRAIDLNSRDNFYYLEQAMDEIYAGVGGDTVTYLKEAYEETVEILVYYDASTKSYVTMDNTQANELMSKTFMQKLKNDNNYNDKTLLMDKLSKFISNRYSASNPEGIQIKFDNFEYGSEGKSYTIKNLVLTRTAAYSTYNASKTSKNGIAGSEEFTQTLSTDLVVGDPDLQVNFNGISGDMSALYDFACVADRGMVIDGGVSGTTRVTGLGNDVTIKGAVYAGADFYNKADGIASKAYYDTSSAKYTSCNGQDTDSMYSGIYVDGAKLRLATSKLVVPGTIAAMNRAELVVTSVTQSSNDYAEVWADGIVLDGYTLKNGGDTLKGSSIDMRAKAFIYDDLELNANSSSFTLNGEYYGYSFSSKDERIFTGNTVSGIKKYLGTSSDGTGVDGQAHYNSSSIILNGENTNLDLSNVDAMYIAGQSYIEVSKKVNKGTTTVGDEETETKTYEFYNDGTQTAYSESNHYTTDGTAVGKSKTSVEDYKTGEAVSIKSNQLAYIPKGMVTETDKGYFINLPNSLKVGKVGEFYKKFWDDLSNIPVVKTVISNKDYYFFDFSNVNRTDNTMNQFIADYTKLFTEEDISTIDTTDTTEDTSVSTLTDITDYDYFSVELLKVSTDENDEVTNIYSNAAITTKEGSTFKVTAKSSSVDALLKAANYLNDAQSGSIAVTDADQYTDSDKAILSGNITNELESQYREMKYMLTNKSTDTVGIETAKNAKLNELTPIKYYFNFDAIEDKTYQTKSGYKVWMSEGDITISDSGDLQGIILAKGDVSFDKSVTEFNGLIVSAGKVYVGHSMDILANEQIVKTILRECDETRSLSGSDNMSLVCDIFTKFVSKYKPTTGDAVATESYKSIGTIGIDDILSMKNWKKNVD